MFERTHEEGILDQVFPTFLWPCTPLAFQQILLGVHQWRI